MGSLFISFTNNKSPRQRRGFCQRSKSGRLFGILDDSLSTGIQARSGETCKNSEEDAVGEIRQAGEEEGEHNAGNNGDDRVPPIVKDPLLRKLHEGEDDRSEGGDQE